ncbi:diguanylate cyclase [Xanthobacter sp. ZOL 2024]
MPFVNIMLLIIGLVLYVAAMLGLFRWRNTLGIGTFFCALGSIHFMETYLAASFYVALPLGASLSPGSVVMFSGKLALLLLVYIREDAQVARQPIYGLLFGNLFLIAFVAVLRLHRDVGGLAGSGELSFLDQLGGLMLWGTALLFLDCIAMILLYERISRPLRRLPFLAIWLTLACVLTFDQAGFFAMLHLAFDVPFSAGIGGWLGKLAAAGLCAAMLLFYLDRFEMRADGPPRRLSDVFDILTYRQRFEELTRASRRDPLTQLLHRGQLEPLGRDLLAVSATTNRPMSLLLIDIDNFKTVNDRHGHPVGDAVLRIVADAMTDALRQSDYVVRYGGDEFVAFAPGVSHLQALRLATMLRERIALLSLPPHVEPLTLSIGVATAPQDADTISGLLTVADQRLYASKGSGRNTVTGAFDS